MATTKKKTKKSSNSGGCPFGGINSILETFNTIRTIRKTFEKNPEFWVKEVWAKTDIQDEWGEFESLDYAKMQRRKRYGTLPNITGVCLNGAFLYFAPPEGYKNVEKAFLKANPDIFGVPDFNDDSNTELENVQARLETTELYLKNQLIVSAAQL